MKWPALGRKSPAATALYNELVALARRPSWYERGEVPDTIDGRFDMVALIVALLLLRLERADTRDAAAQLSADITERFIADMDGSMRQLGFGDPAVGKRVGEMVSALGGRLGAYRDALAGLEPLDAALARNLYRGVAIDAGALAWAAGEVEGLVARFDALPLAALHDGQLGGTR